MKQTATRIQHLAGSPLGPQSRSHMWTPTTVQEMKLYLVKTMLPGVVHKLTRTGPSHHSLPHQPSEIYYPETDTA